MIKFDKCIRCNSENIEKIKVDTRISLSFPEKKNPFSNAITQRIICPTDAIICNECGHIEFFFDIEKW